MKHKLFPITIIFALIITFWVFYKGLSNPNIYIPRIANEQNIPVISFKIFKTNKKINSDEIFKTDKFYLMNIWASWCIPCLDEHPYLMDLSQNRKMEIIGLNYKDNFENANNFISKFGNPYKLILTDKDGTASINWGAYGVPESFLIHKNQIIKKYIGPITEEILLEINEMVK